MPTPNPGHGNYLTFMAGDILAVAVDALDENRTGSPAPSRVYVSHGTPAVPPCTTGRDTGQLTVHLNDIIYKGLLPTAQMPGSRQLGPVADWRVQLWRCVPALQSSGSPQSADTLGAVQERLAIDGWTLFTYVLRRAYAEKLFTACSFSTVQIARAAALPPQGISAGWELQVLVGLNDAGPL